LVATLLSAVTYATSHQLGTSAWQPSVFSLTVSSLNIKVVKDAAELDVRAVLPAQNHDVTEHSPASEGAHPEAVAPPEPALVPPPAPATVHQGQPGLVIAGFVCALVGLLLTLSVLGAPVGVPLGIIGLVFSLVGLHQVKLTGRPLGLAISGVICGAVSLLVGLVLLVVFVVAVSSSSNYCRDHHPNFTLPKIEQQYGDHNYGWRYPPFQEGPGQNQPRTTDVPGHPSFGP
jgi:hypothetical protein